MKSKMFSESDKLLKRKVLKQVKEAAIIDTTTRNLRRF